MYKVILFYKYISIAKPQELKEDQLKIAGELDLKGRMIIAKEGINGTFEGINIKIDEYIRAMKKDSRFKDIDFKTSPGNGEAFPKLSIKVRDEIVTSHLGEEIDPTEDTGEYIDPEELHEWYGRNKDFQVIDMRNRYEYKSGHFEGAIDLNTKAFRELSEKTSDLEEIKDKPVVTVCTGGVRCEKASALLKQKGFKNVYQLKGGIHRYIEDYPDGHFKGSLYVFDKRMTMATASEDKRDIVGRCEFCGCTTENYADDDSTSPSKQVLCCEECFLKRKNNLRPASPVLRDLV